MLFNVLKIQFCCPVKTSLMENPARTVLEENLKTIRECNMDPGKLAVALLAAGIIDGNDEERARMKGELASDKRIALVRSVMGNGAPQVFQQFVQIFLDQRSTKWLGEKLKGIYVQSSMQHNNVEPE